MKPPQKGAPPSFTQHYLNHEHSLVAPLVGAFVIKTREERVFVTIMSAAANKYSEHWFALTGQLSVEHGDHYLKEFRRKAGRNYLDLKGRTDRGKGDKTEPHDARVPDVVAVKKELVAAYPRYGDQGAGLAYSSVTNIARAVRMFKNLDTDVEWLVKQGLMDDSLLVTFSKHTQRTKEQKFLPTTEIRAYVGLIDITKHFYGMKKPVLMGAQFLEAITPKNLQQSCVSPPRYAQRQFEGLWGYIFGTDQTYANILKTLDLKAKI